MAVLLAALMLPAGAAAKTFEPTRKDDPVPNGCRPSNCSLREATIAANARDGRDRVVLDKGTYKLEIPVSAEPSGDIDLTDGVVLSGQGRSRTRIDADDIDRVLSVGSDNELGDSFAVRGVTLTDGTAPNGAGLEAVSFEDDTLSLTRVAITDNEANAPMAGGGIFSEIAKLTINRSAVVDNESTNFGGGMRFGTSSSPADAEVTIRRSRIHSNEAPFGGGIYAFTPNLSIQRTTISDNSATEGGGLDIVGQQDPPETTILASTISGNDAGKGAGILADGNQPSASFDPPVVTMVNSTVAGNLASADGGGIMGDNEATVDVGNSTIAANQANSDNLNTAVAGGVYQHSNANFSVDDSILAHNFVGQGGSDPDCSATEVFSGAGNVLSSTDGCDVSFTTPFNLYSALLIAAALDDNGGPTETMRVPAGSPAIGFANNCPKRDQRGELRPDNCDSGAFENRPKR
jgi:hypothetical protein